MKPVIYKVKNIEGEYAILEEEESHEELFIALALLPFGTDLGSRLKFEDFSYELIEN